MYEHGGRLGNVTKTILIISCPSLSRRPHIKFDLDMQSYFKEKCLKIMVIYMQFSPWTGVDNLLRPSFQHFKCAVNVVICCKTF